MRKFSMLLFLVNVCFAVTPAAIGADKPAANLAGVQEQMDQTTDALSRNIEQLEDLMNRLAALGRANANYDEQKNIWLSSTLTLAAINAVCEYENDLLTLFMDLREKNRRHFYEVRIMSLETSIRQISIMNRQIDINHALITHEASEQALIDIEKKLIFSSIALLKKSLSLIKSLQP